MTKPVPPPTVDQTRTVILQTPGGMQVIISEDNIPPRWWTDDDEIIARAYARETGLPATVQVVRQTTVRPVTE